EIRRCLKSITAQTVQPSEVIIVDDGSTDGGAAVAETVLRPGMRIISQANQGAAVARNTGIRAARSPLIAFLDADDEWCPAFLSQILLLESTFPEAAAFCTGLITDRGRFRRFRTRPNTPAGLKLFAVGEGLNEFPSPAHMWSSAITIRREIVDTIGFFR